MNRADDERLPPSIGGLVDFAVAAYAERAVLYIGLAVAVFLIQGAVEAAIPAAKLDTPQGALKLLVLEYTALFVDAYVIAAVALGVGMRAAAEPVSSGRIAGTAAQRWLPVLVTSVLAQTVAFWTGPFSGFGALPDPAAILLFTAPFVWLVWGVLGLAQPITALSGERPAFAVIAGVTRAVAWSLRSSNFRRLSLVAFVTIVPNLLQTVAYDVMLHQHVARPLFWAYVPIDALTVGPVAALQAAFALDFARRAGDQRSA
ncbi:MAG TPA: hypothetical protein VFF00_01415 [Candidatus Elarobacter sp.]|nr:hypothetical protein [Candidatus Elarobacter sp.]